MYCLLNKRNKYWVGAWHGLFSTPHPHANIVHSHNTPKQTHQCQGSTDMLKTRFKERNIPMSIINSISQTSVFKGLLQGTYIGRMCYCLCIMPEMRKCLENENAEKYRHGLGTRCSVVSLVHSVWKTVVCAFLPGGLGLGHEGAGSFESGIGLGRFLEG